MARELSRRELDELFGAYALDAVDDDEREQVEEYLARAPEARSLVADYRETAALLAHSGTEAPPGLWERIEQALEEEPPRLATPRAAAVGFESGRARLRRRAAVVVAAAAAVVVVALLTVKVVQQGDRIDELGREARAVSVLAAAEGASRDPRAHRVALSSTDGALEARVLYLPGGDGFLLQSNLRALPSDRTYQLWALIGGSSPERPISAGVLGPDPGVTAFRVHGPVVGFAITDEQSPGVVSPGSPPLIQGAVS
ncbi:MAG TPA: anti-sigma factor [Acidimicrobiia bacterium]|nr:anti-sigma factor [Acidimicrobiia bacterium]